MKDYKICRETYKLMTSSGYWSGNIVYFNLTSDTVFILNEKLDHEIIWLTQQFTEFTCFTFLDSYFKQWLENAHLGALNINNLLTPESRSWLELIGHLKNSGLKKRKIHPHLSNEWLKKNQNSTSNSININKLDRLSKSLSPLLLDWNSLLKGDTETFLEKIIRLSQLNTHLTRVKNQQSSTLKQKEKQRLIISDFSIEERTLIEWALPILSPTSNETQYFNGACHARNASAGLLAWLRHKDFILLPRGFKNVSFWLQSFPIWPESQLQTHASNEFKNSIYDFIASSSAADEKDIPQNIVQLYKPSTNPSTFYSHLANWLKHPSVELNRPVFPISFLHYNKIIAEEKLPKWSPEWIKEKTNNSWHSFSKEWWSHNNTADSNKRTVLKGFLEWAWEERSFTSPWDIEPLELRNHGRESYNGTFFNYLKRKNANIGAVWSSSKNMYTKVCQLALLPNSPFLDESEIRNPFDQIPSPAIRNKRSTRKTLRASLPAIVHELMIDILLSLDENGFPTFSWAKKSQTIAKYDFVRVTAPDDPKKELETWCPSRATCLALLLLLPIRGAQARWLDQGLMDDEIFDFSTARMIPNGHPLRNFRYSNNKTQKEQYGRPTGVLQMSSDLLVRVKTLSIYVNTNKTQLWNGLKKTGYEIPWPDGTDLLKSENSKQREQGQWLSRVYRVLQYQLEWLQTYDPNPHPLSFFHSTEDVSRTTDLDEVKSNMPWFVPMFRDLSLGKYVTDVHNGKSFRASCPISKQKIDSLYNRLALETEKRFFEKFGEKISLTTESGKCTYNLHSLRVTWVSRLFEMGVPIHVISEYITGHATSMMTIHYLKFQPFHVREQLLQAVAENDTTFGIDALFEKIHKSGSLKNSLVSSPNSPELVNLSPENYVAITPVTGGICPMGGKGSKCHVGAITNGNTSDSAQPGEVQGGCGNCRFFMTGPDFLIEQMLTCNSIMLKIRAFGREQKTVYLQLDEVAHELHSLTASEPSTKFKLEYQRQYLKSRIDEIDSAHKILCIELVNRHEMLLQSYELLNENTEDKQLTLLSDIPLSIDDFSLEEKETSDFGLVRTAFEQARIVKKHGIPVPDDHGRLLREFVNIILHDNAIDNLLLRIPDIGNQTVAASILAGFISDEFKEDSDKIQDSIIQKAIDNREPLPFSISQNEKLQTITTKIVDHFKNKEKSDSLLPLIDKIKGPS